MKGKLSHNCCVHELALGIGKRIGNGQSTPILDSPWVYGRKIQFKQGIVAQNLDCHAWVGELITEDKEWEEDKLDNLLDSTTLRTILSIHIPEQTSEDEFNWEAKKHGNYEIKSGYGYLKNLT